MDATDALKIMHLLLLATTVLIGCHTLWMLSRKPAGPRYRHPSDAIGVGPVWTKEQGPPLHYMYIWKEDQRLKMEFRNLPGVVIACYSGVIQELSESMKKLVDTEECPKYDVVSSETTEKT